MPVVAVWDDPDEKTIIRYEIWGRWSAKEFDAELDHTDEMLSSINHERTVHYIVMLDTGIWMPGGLGSTLDRLAAAKRRKLNMTVMIGTSPIVRSMVSLYQDRYGKIFQLGDYQFAKSLDDARAMIEDFQRRNGDL